LRLWVETAVYIFISGEKDMYTLIRSIPLRDLLLEQLTALFISFVIAELFYKFHSFTLECIGFLITWYVADFIIGTVSEKLSTRQSPKK
jgi:hypothetical protein